MYNVQNIGKVLMNAFMSDQTQMACGAGPCRKGGSAPGG